MFFIVDSVDNGEHSKLLVTSKHPSHIADHMNSDIFSRSYVVASETILELSFLLAECSAGTC